MRIWLIVLALGVSVGLAARQATTTSAIRSFEDDRVGVPPAGFTFAEARGAAPNRWVVQRVDQNSVLTQLGDAARGGFTMAILDGAHKGELRLSVRLKLVDGERSGGLVWRYRDPDNYHVAWLNLSEQTVGAYRITSGNRVRISSEDDLELDSGAWHTLRMVQEDDEIRVYIAGIKVFDVRDRSLLEPGRVGLWSTGGSVVQFDDFRIETEETQDEAPRRRGRS